MIRAFLDASVLFSACYSATGASRELLMRAIRHEFIVVISDIVQEEARRNLAIKAPMALPALEQLLELVPFELLSAPLDAVLAAQQYTELKDAPIVAAAITARADFLVSLDRTHLVDIPHVAESSGISIVLPSVLLHQLRNAAV